MSLKILTVFDCEQAKDWIATTLANHEVTRVSTIMSAMQILQYQKVDVILVQLHLQNESLFDLLRSIRRNDYYSDLKFICCETSQSANHPIMEMEFLEKACLLNGATKVVPIDQFYSENFTREFEEIPVSLGPKSGVQ